MAQYKVYGTNGIYNGEVVEIGGSLYTTKGGALEGDSLQVIADASSVRDVVNTVNNRESTSALANAMRTNGGLTTPTNNQTDVVTTFIVGDGSLFGNASYFYNLAGTNRVPRSTELHHHTIPPDNRNSFMTQHTMDGNETDVYSIQQVNARRAGRAPAVGGPGRANGSINIGVSPGITPPPGDDGGGGDIGAPKFGQNQMENQGGSGY